MGLALCGVGYDIVDLQNFKHRPCAVGLNKGKGKRAVSSFFEEGEAEEDEDEDESGIIDFTADEPVDTGIKPKLGSCSSIKESFQSHRGGEADIRFPEG